MKDKIKTIINDLFTEANNTTYDLSKILALLAILDGLVLVSYDVIIKGLPFNFQDFGTGVGLLFAGLGFALGFKKETI